MKKGGDIEMKDVSTREDYRALVQRSVYQALSSAGEICRLRCFDPGDNGDPDLLDSIAHGIMQFLSDGDVFDQVVRTLISLDPGYFGDKLNEISMDTAKAVIAKVLGEHPSDLH